MPDDLGAAFNEVMLDIMLEDPKTVRELEFEGPSTVYFHFEPRYEDQRINYALKWLLRQGVSRENILFENQAYWYQKAFRSPKNQGEAVKVEILDGEEYVMLKLVHG